MKTIKLTINETYLGNKLRFLKFMESQEYQCDTRAIKTALGIDTKELSNIKAYFVNKGVNLTITDIIGDRVMTLADKVELNVVQSQPKYQIRLERREEEREPGSFANVRDVNRLMSLVSFS